jgi:hypothetical protein
VRLVERRGVLRHPALDRQAQHLGGLLPRHLLALAVAVGHHAQLVLRQPLEPQLADQLPRQPQRRHVQPHHQHHAGGKRQRLQPRHVGRVAQVQDGEVEQAAEQDDRLPHGRRLDRGGVQRFGLVGQDADAGGVLDQRLPQHGGVEALPVVGQVGDGVPGVEVQVQGQVGHAAADLGQGDPLRRPLGQCEGQAGGDRRDAGAGRGRQHRDGLAASERHRAGGVQLLQGAEQFLAQVRLVHIAAGTGAEGLEDLLRVRRGADRQHRQVGAGQLLDQRQAVGPVGAEHHQHQVGGRLRQPRPQVDVGDPVGGPALQPHPQGHLA